MISCVRSNTRVVSAERRDCTESYCAETRNCVAARARVRVAPERALRATGVAVKAEAERALIVEQAHGVAWCAEGRVGSQWHVESNRKRDDDIFLEADGANRKWARVITPQNGPYIRNSPLEKIQAGEDLAMFWSSPRKSTSKLRLLLWTSSGSARGANDQ